MDGCNNTVGRRAFTVKVPRRRYFSKQVSESLLIFIRRDRAIQQIQIQNQFVTSRSVQAKKTGIEGTRGDC